MISIDTNARKCEVLYADYDDTLATLELSQLIRKEERVLEEQEVCCLEEEVIHYG